MSQWQNINPGDEIPKEALPLNAKNLNNIEEKLSNTVQKSGTNTPMEAPLYLRTLVKQDEYGITHIIDIDENEAVSKEYIEAYWDDFFANTYDHTWRDFSLSTNGTNPDTDWYSIAEHQIINSDEFGYYHAVFKIKIKGKFNYLIFYHGNGGELFTVDSQVTSPQGVKYAGACIKNLTNEWQEMPQIVRRYTSSPYSHNFISFKREDDILMLDIYYKNAPIVMTSASFAVI